MPESGPCPYSCMIPSELDRAIQKRALELASKNLLLDERGDPIEIRIGPNGKHVARYAIARVALSQFANGERLTRTIERPESASTEEKLK
jgi:hypothetical protein